MKPYSSWGRYPKSNPAQVVPLYWLSSIPQLDQFAKPVLAHGRGRSYGDSCLNDGGVLLDTLELDRFIHLDPQSGVLRCEAGVSLEEIIRLALPAGWFLPVSPGTQFVTVGGAVANDVHGKNHHRAGSFGCHVRCLEVLRSDGERVICSRDENSDLFCATVAGLGLTGLILWVELQLKRAAGPWIDCETIRFRRVEEFFALSAESDQTHEYTVAWLDCVSGEEKLGRGLFMRGNHSPRPLSGTSVKSARAGLVRGFDAPEFLINRGTVRMFNSLYFHAPMRDFKRQTVSYQKFFYPLDSVTGWNKLYGKRGFLQYQFVVPFEKREAVTEVLEMIGRSRLVCTLSVLKIFGGISSPGLLSFPRPGVTLALDFPIQGDATFELCRRFDEVVLRCGGAVYPAKDARMPGSTFEASFPKLGEFAGLVDPHFSSDFWRRVSGGGSTQS